MVKIRRGYRSRNVEYRGSTGGRRGLPMPLPRTRGGRVGAGLGGAGLLGVLAVILISLLGGGGAGGGGLDDVLGQLGKGSAGTGSLGDGVVADESPFLEVVFDDVQNYWAAYLEGYPEAKMVIFRESVETDGCGTATAAVGPFYCPADRMVYLDQDFFDVLAGSRFGAPGDFAQAYVIAHEVAHHVQTVTGISDEVRVRQSAAGSPEDSNAWTIRLEVQADCLAGSWASVAARRPPVLEGTDNLLYLDRGDIGEGLEAARAVGDDRIQESSGVDVDPHAWTHGSASQREAWFTLGLDSGDPTRCQSVFDDSAEATEVMPG